MSTITANSTAAYFTYIGERSSATTGDPGSRIWQARDSMKLRIQGSALYLYGNLLPSDPGTSTGGISSPYNVTINTQSSNSTYTGNATVGDEGEFLICEVLSLDVNKPNNITLSLDFLGEGLPGFDLGRVEWTNPNLSNQPVKSFNGNSTFFNFTNWTPDEQDGPRCTTSNNATMQFNFEGTSVVVKGMATTKDLNATYRVFVDNSSTLTPGNLDRWEAYASQNQTIDLYRYDNLTTGNHTILFSEIQPGGQLCVLQADVSGPVPSTTVVPSSTGVPSSSASASSSPSKHLSGGETAGIVIGVLLAVGIIVGGALFVYRRRMGYGGIALDAKKMRYCSKCGAAITDRYRMECVQAESCVQDVDLHVKCQDWNIPTNHSHPIHKTVNK